MEGDKQQQEKCQVLFHFALYIRFANGHTNYGPASTEALKHASNSGCCWIFKRMLQG